MIYDEVNTEALNVAEKAAKELVVNEIRRTCYGASIVPVDVFLLWASMESGTWVGMLTSEMTSKHYYEVSYDIASRSGIVSVFRKVSDNYYTKTRKVISND